jgi:hypothetical protein
VIHIKGVKEKIISPAIYQGVAYPDYGVGEVSGYVYSIKSGYWKQLSTRITGKSKYPIVNIYSNSDCMMTPAVHRVAGETCIPFPEYPGIIPNEEWDLLSEKTRNHLSRTTLQINHIDHNTRNHSISNLEWVTAEGNRSAYQEHRSGTETCTTLFDELFEV